MRFYIERPHRTKPGRFVSEWLPGVVTRESMVDEAWALLADPRDTIACVKVWNERWGQFEPVTFAPGWSYDGSHKDI